MENKKSPLLSAVINNGLIFGASLVVLNVLFYLLIDMESISLFALAGLGFAAGFLPLVIGLILLIRNYKKKELGGFMKYKQGLWYGTYVTFTAAIVLALYTLVFNNVIDPDYTKKTQEAVVEKTLSFMELSGVPQDMIEEQMEQLEEAMNNEIDNAKLITPLKSILITTITGFVISLILAAILKKEPSVFEGSELAEDV